MEENYEVVKTLIRGKQNKKVTETKSGIRLTRHKKPVGYAIKNLTTNETEVVTDLEATLKVLEEGATNVMVTATRKTKEGTISPYIRSKPDTINLQDEKMVMDPVEYVDSNKNLIISEKMEKIINKFRASDKKERGSDKIEPRYTKEELLRATKKLMK